MIKTPRTVAMILSLFGAASLGSARELRAPSRVAARLAMADAGPVITTNYGPRTNKKSRWKRARRTHAYHDSH